MDTVIANKYNEVLSTLDIDVSKKLEGEYEVDEIISSFGNYFFNKMFLDITAIKDYKDLKNLQKLSMSIDMDKVIILLDKDDSISDSNSFLSRLVDMGIYNFTKDKDSLMYLYNNPNIYRDVAYLQTEKNVTYDEKNNNYEKEEHSLKHSGKIIGIKNVTDSAGATTLTYLMKKVLSEYYSVMAFELENRNIIYFKDNDCKSIKENELEDYLDKYTSTDIFLIDLDKSKKEHMCSEVIYLVEPTTIKLNELSMINPNIFKELEGKKIVLNKSLLDDSDVADFEVESKLKVFYNMPPLNDKKDISNEVLPLLEKLELVKSVPEEEQVVEKKSLFNLFKMK